MHAAAIAASSQNKLSQPLSSTSAPPRRGPTAAPAADAAPQSVIARICPLPEEPTDSRLIPQARIVAPAAPWISRPMMIPAPLVDSAMNTQEAMKRASPARKMRLRPNTSPSAPDVTITAAPTSM